MRKNKRIEIVRLLMQGVFSPTDIHKKTKIGLSLVNRHLRDLVSSGYVEKIGKPPSTLYSLAQHPSHLLIKSPIIDKHFVFIDLTVGSVFYGVEGFLLWSPHNLKKYSLYEKVLLYEDRIRETESLRNKSLVFSLNSKLSAMGEKIFLQEVSSAFLNSMPDFGLTKQSVLLSIAKEGASRAKKFGHSLIDDFFPILSRYMGRYDFDAVLFVPPSAKRRVQIMSLLTEEFKDNFPNLPIIKAKKRHGDVILQQKSIKGLPNRLANAEATFVVGPADTCYDKVLLIDDFVGSGATLNVLARKVLEQDIAKEVYGIGMVGIIEKGFVVVKKT